MSTENNKAIARRFAQIWGKGSLNIVDELAAPNISVSYPLLPETVHGPEAFKQVLMMVHSGLPDADVSVEEEIAEGDKVVVRWTMRGTHMSELMGIPPTGKQATWTGITIYRLADGKIVEEKGEEDSLGLMQQLGAVPAPTQAR
jgi:steroid delta-isomerase-like uncharacterized protein